MIGEVGTFCHHETCKELIVLLLELKKQKTISVRISTTKDVYLGKMAAYEPLLHKLTNVDFVFLGIIVSRKNDIDLK